MRSLLISAAILGVTAIAGTTPAHAQEPEVPPSGMYIGIFGGGNLVLDNWDLYKSADGGVSPDHSGIFGIRIGGNIIPWLGLEASLSVLPYTASGDNDGLALSYSGDILINFIEGRWVPFLIVGAGAYHNVDGNFGSDVDYHAHYGLGLRGQLTDWMSLRFDIRHMLTDTYVPDEGVASNLELLAGLDFWVIANKRIPDTDGDGLLDNVDSCPKEPGPQQFQGCPDSDGDGIIDRDDRCPNKKGLKAYKGCPDQDKDGIADIDDACPTVFGIAALDGCPDKDGDGITDAEDKCPMKAGPKKFDGCPDTDNDGIIDLKDKCPTVPGIAEEQGCPFVPKEVKEQFSGRLDGIYFATGSATIQKKSFPVLDNVADVLAKYEAVQVRIEGHTDSRGKDDANMALSQARAESVRTYLIQKGIDAERMSAKGFGETKPVGNNKTRKGRQQNRRIEFHIVER